MKTIEGLLQMAEKIKNEHTGNSNSGEAISFRQGFRESTDLWKAHVEERDREIEKLNHIIGRKVSDELVHEYFKYMKDHGMEADNDRLKELLGKAKVMAEWYANPCGKCEEQWIGTCHGSPQTAREFMQELEREGL